MFRAVASGFLIACTLVAGSANAAWPERTVTIVTPFAAGGIADVVARLTAEAARINQEILEPGPDKG